jgi:hypothetical protein
MCTERLGSKGAPDSLGGSCQELLIDVREEYHANKICHADTSAAAISFWQA